MSVPQRRKPRPGPLDLYEDTADGGSAPPTPAHAGTPRYGASSNALHAKARAEASRLLGVHVDDVVPDPDYEETGSMVVHLSGLRNPADTVAILERARGLGARVGVDTTHGGRTLALSIRPHLVRWRRVHDLLLVGTALVAAVAGAFAERYVLA